MAWCKRYHPKGPASTSLPTFLLGDSGYSKSGGENAVSEAGEPGRFLSSAQSSCVVMGLWLLLPELPWPHL